jgi:4-hydroxy-tetrahydrodipicolinate synthase
MSDAVLPSGVIGATLTPFTDGNRVDRDRLTDLIDLMVTHCDAISVMGAEVSEYSVLAPDARIETLTHGIGAVDGRVPVIAGASSRSVAEAIRLSEIAATAGASFIQVLAPLQPGGNAASAGDLVTYFEQVAELSALPIVVYLNPPSGSDPTPETLIRISEIDRVVGFKESSRDITKIGRLCEQIDEAGHARYFTTMQPLLATLTLGGSGAMMPPPGTLVGARIVDAFRQGDLGEAVRWQRAFRLFPGLWGKKYGLSPTMKAALAASGFDIGAPAAPFRGLPDEDLENLAALLKALGLPELIAAAAVPDRSRS